MSGAEPVSPHLLALATGPRPAGSNEAARARDYCAAHLRTHGFTTIERPFDYSALPGRYAAQILGVVGGTSVIATAVTAERHFAFATLYGWSTLIIVVVLMILLGGSNATREPFMQRHSVNLEAVRGERPAVWLVAHIDSKSQSISTALRTLGIVALGLGVIAGLFVFIIPPGLVGAFGLTGGILLACAGVGSNSDGAADNASGVAAVLHAVEQLSIDQPVGVLITDAEELALAGANAWVLGTPPAIAINCDTVDDDGRLVVMRYGSPKDGLVQLAGRVARDEDPQALVIRPLPGVLTDSVPFRRANWQTVTLSRGTIRTLNRIHTGRDNLRSMRGTGIPAAARVLARLVKELA